MSPGPRRPATCAWSREMRHDRGTPDPARPSPQDPEAADLPSPVREARASISSAVAWHTGHSGSLESRSLPSLGEDHDTPDTARVLPCFGHATMQTSGGRGPRRRRRMWWDESPVSERAAQSSLLTRGQFSEYAKADTARTRSFAVCRTNRCASSCCRLAYDFIGGLGRIRTPDLLIRSQALYPTELRVRGGAGYPASEHNARGPAPDTVARKLAVPDCTINFPIIHQTKQ
jgi:hypothetical protein